jgi:PAS domain S-box-containing protein
MTDRTNPLENFQTGELLKFLEEGLLLTDLEGNILSLNHAGSSVFGYGNALELVGKNFRDLFWKTDDFGKFLDTIKKTGEIQEYLIFGRKRDGHPAYIQAYSRLHPPGAEKPEGIATLFKDVSERELFKRALERSEDRYKTLFNSISEGYVRFNADDQIVFINPAGAHILGFASPMEALGQQITEMWQDPMALVDFKDRLTQRGEIERERVELELRSGQRITVEVTEHVVRNRDGQIVGSDAMFKDVTEQRALQESLVENAQKLHEIVSSCAEMMIVTDVNGKITFVNNAYHGIFGYSPQDAVGRQLGYITVPEDRERLEEARKEVLQGRPLHNFELRVYRRDGTEVRTAWSASALRDVAGRIKGLIAIGRDVTERRKAEDSLRESQRFLSDIFTSIQDGISILDKEFNILAVNPTMEKWYAHAMPLVGKKCYEAYHLSQEPCKPCPAQRVVETGKAARDVIARTGEGGKKTGWQEVFSFPLFDTDTGAIKGVIDYIRDITEQRRAEQKILEERDFSRNIIQSSPAFFVAIDPAGKLLLMNDAMLNALGYAAEDVIGKQYLPIFVPEREHAAVSATFSRLVGGQTSVTENHVLAKDGRELLVEWHGTPVIGADGLTHFFGIGLDRTGRKEAEDRAKFLASVVEQTTEGVGVSDLEGNILVANRSAAAMHGWEPGELLGKNVSVLHTPDQMPASKAAFKEAMEAGEFYGEMWHARRDGTPFLTFMRNSVLRNEAGEPVGVIATMRDITEAKRAEAALRKEKEFSERIIENANNIVITLDTGGRITTFNRFAEELSGYARAEVMGKVYFDIFLTEQDREPQRQDFDTFIKGSPPITGINPIVCKDRVERIILWSTSLLTGADGAVIGLLAIGKDITERPLAQFPAGEEENLDRAVLRASAALLLVANSDGTVVQINDALARLTGFTEGELKGRTIWETIIPRDKEQESRRHFAALFSGKRPAVIDRPILTKSGEMRHVIWTYDFIRDAAGKPCRIVATGTDLTEMVDFRKRIERSESLYQSLVDNSPNIVLRADTSGKITFVGGGGRQSVGYTDDEVLAKPISGFLHPDDRKDVEAAFMRAAGGEIVENVVGRVITRSGGTLHMSNNARPVRNEQGEVVEVQITSRDISPLVRLQEQLRQYSEELEKLVETRTIALRDSLRKRAEEELYAARLQQMAPVAFLASDENFIIRSWNAAAEKIFGYTAEEAMGRSPEFLVPPERMNDFHEIIGRNLKGETVRGFESVGLTKDGRRIEVKVDSMALLDEKGKRIRGLCLIEDVSRQKAAQRALEDAGKRLQMVLEEIPEYGIFSTDANFVITYFGPGCERLTGWKAGEVVGKEDAHILKPPPETNPRAHPLHEAFLSGAPASEPVQIRRKDGSLVAVSAAIKPMLDKNGVMQGVVGVLHDISQEHELLSRLFEEARHRALSAVTTGIAAEFNEMLTRLDQRAALARDDAGSAGKLAESIHEEVSRARALTVNLARFTHPAAQPFRLVNPANIVEEVAQLLQGECQAAGVRMIKTYHRTGETLMRTEDVQHAMLNLILAAATNAGKGGSVEIIVQQDEATITITVKDNGQGMEAADLSRAFEPQFWLEASSRPGKGLTASMGLGLITARKAAEEHGGTVEIESESGVGTTVRLKLPVKTVRRGRKTTRKIPSAQAGAAAEKMPLRVLVADDEAHIRSVIAYIAKEKHHICETVTSLAEARNLCAERKFDVAIIDEGLGNEADLAAAIAAVKGPSPKARVFIMADPQSQAFERLKHLVDGALTHTFSVEDIQRLLGG